MSLPDPLARLRPSPPDPSVHLSHIAEVSRNARTTWFGLLGILAFVGITLLAHKDADFFTRAAATKLPLINISVPVTSFFYTAPVLVASLYAYLHLYLMSLWDALADAPARVDGQPLSDRVYPWLINHALLWYRDRKRGDGSSAPRALGRTIAFISFFLGWFFGGFILLALWVRSMPVHDPVLTLWIGACLFFATLIGLTGLASAAKRMRGISRQETARRHGVRWYSALIFALLLIFFSWETTKGGLLPHEEDALPPLLMRANLEGAELTPRPKDWKPFEFWLRDYRLAHRGAWGIGDPEEDPLIPTPAEMGRWDLHITALDAPDLSGRDFRGAHANGIFMPGANLSEADFRRANLWGAQLQQTDLAYLQAQGVELSNVWLQGAYLWQTRLQGANLGYAQMQGAILDNTYLQNTNLTHAKMQGMHTNSAFLDGSDLDGAGLQGANLSGASLSWTNLSNASLEGTDCSRVYFNYARVDGADLRCRRDTLDVEQLEEAFGNDKTLLPDGMRVRDCIEESSLHEGIEKTEKELFRSWLYPDGAGQFEVRVPLEIGRDPVRFVMCTEGKAPRLVGRWSEDSETD